MGTPTYFPQNDTHDTVIIWNLHKWGEMICSIPHGPSTMIRPGGRVRGKKMFLALQAFSNSLPYSEDFENKNIA